jgi:3'(2'), 5'-bisphosphate nucleotidase
VELNVSERKALLEALADVAVEAGGVIWDIFQRDDVVQQTKKDSSPVTEADEAAEKIILAALARLAPGVPVVAEEEVAAGRIPDVDRQFFLVDPLDGTKEFIKRGTDFTVNIALVEDHKPTLGVVFAPARDELYWGDTKSGVAFLATQKPKEKRAGGGKPIRIRPLGAKLAAVASKSHDTPETEAYLKACNAAERVSIGSSLKFVLVASGQADVYPRPAPTMEWDTAAGHAVLLAAGGKVFDLDGAPLAYGKERFFNPGFVATGSFEPPTMRPFLAGKTQ